MLLNRSGSWSRVSQLGGRIGEIDDEGRRKEGPGRGLPFEHELDEAAEAIRVALLRLVREGETHPHVIVLAAACVVGELAAAKARLGRTCGSRHATAARQRR